MSEPERAKQRALETDAGRRLEAAVVESERGPHWRSDSGLHTSQHSIADSVYPRSLWERGNSGNKGTASLPLKSNDQDDPEPFRTSDERLT